MKMIEAEGDLILIGNRRGDSGNDHQVIYSIQHFGLFSVLITNVPFFLIR